MLQSVSEPIFSQVFVTDELGDRPVGRADYLKEKMALQDLAARLVASPDDVLPRFVELAMQMTDGTAAGLSVYDSEGAVFKWMHLCGELAAFEGATTPRNYSPCGVTLDRREPTLVRHPEWAYSWVSDANITLAEVLLVPLLVGGEDPIGTLWIASQQERHFNLEHARIASELATFVGIALHIKQGEQRLKQALQAQETLTHEMNHRVKNVFALTDGMIRQTVRTATTKEDMAQSLSGRLRALATAHSMVLRENAETHDVLDFEELVKAIIEPHVHSGNLFTDQVHIAGLPLSCASATSTSLALIFNELATNSSKYGALGIAGGRLSVAWDVAGDVFRIVWAETSVPSVDAPTEKGFGSTLIEATVVRQFRGTFNIQWTPEGLVVEIELPSKRFIR